MTGESSCGYVWHGLGHVLLCSMGEARACWSLGNAYTVMGDYKQALSYAVTHYQLAFKVLYAHMSVIGDFDLMFY